MTFQVIANVDLPDRRLRIVVSNQVVEYVTEFERVWHVSRGLALDAARNGVWDSNTFYPPHSITHVEISEHA